MDCKYTDVCKYLLALEFTLDSEIGDLKMYENPLGDFLTVNVDGDRISDVLLEKVLIDIGKTRQDFDLFVNGH